ncbi:hypothetical protein OG874_25810 [Nocardia sp. NBC_00565]|uniref:ATP-grasp domain-containing protein n=1 Tax=Nocardia sp. NBC_00565 TaxID=2975993 RepID=UPI002E800CD9|nr:hypothetical protein [Nocardia sp. NBC_00565]WUC00307.1 hypothetical protein OG874_25810 [Nocardia sp. NBC_00565]
MPPHVTVIHRVRGVEVPYLDRIDHNAYVVTYVCAKDLIDGIPVHAAAAVERLDDMTRAPDAVRALAARFGTPDRIVALHEFDLLIAAQLRVEFGIAGDRPDYVLPFRDKLVMGATVAGAGVATPPFAQATELTAITDFASAHGFPLIVKPCLGAGSKDIIRLNSIDDCAALPDLSSEPFLVQRFCPDEVGAVDGVWTGTELGPWRASQYLGTCLEFASGGTSLGYVEIDDPAVIAALTTFTEAVLTALSKGTPTVFHLEFFLGRTGGTPRIQFLEVAARASGGETTHMWREVHCYDLLGAAVDIQLGRIPAADPLIDDSVVGELLIHPPVTPPCTVVDVRLEVPPTHAPYHSSVPQPGTAITETFGYADVGAAFRFRGSSTAEVVNAMRYTAAGFRMDCVAYDAAVV